METSLKKGDRVYRFGNMLRVATIVRIYTAEGTLKADVKYTTGTGEKRETWNLDDCALAD